MRTVFVDGLANVLDALEGQGRFVHVSSTGVYAQRDGEAVDETAATEPASESGRVVLEAERLLRERRPGAVVLRFAGIYGPGRLIREKDVRAGEALSGDPEQWLNLIHVEDGAAAVAAALERGRPGTVCNVCDDRPVRRRDFYARWPSCSGRRRRGSRRPWRAPRRIGSIAGSSIGGCGRSWAWRCATRVTRRGCRRPSIRPPTSDTKSR